MEEETMKVGFVENYNAEWWVGKSGFVDPREAREAWVAALTKEAA